MLKRISTLLILIFCCYINGATSNPSTKIIIMTGPSCAGKSSLAEAFVHEFADEHWISINFGFFRLQILNEKAKELGLVPQDYVNENNIILDQEVQKSLAKLDQDTMQRKREAWSQAFALGDTIFFDHVERLCTTHKNIILDIPLYTKNTLSCLLKSKLKDYDCFFVFVHIPFEKLLERIMGRNSRSNLKEYRYVNQVLYRYFLYYQLTSNKNNKTLEKVSKAQLRTTIVDWTYDKEYFVTLPTHHDLANHIVKSLKFDEDVMFLEPTLTYDFVIDTSKYSPTEGSFVLHNAAFQSFGTHFFENSETSIS